MRQWPRTERVARQTGAMEGMLRRLAIEPIQAVRQGDYETALRRCIACPASACCAAWLAGTEAACAVPAFCPNSAFLSRLQASACMWTRSARAAGEPALGEHVGEPTGGWVMDGTVVVLLWFSAGLLGSLWWQPSRRSIARQDIPDLAMAALLGPFTPLIAFLAQHIDLDRVGRPGEARVPVRVRSRRDGRR